MSTRASAAGCAMPCASRRWQPGRRETGCAGFTTSLLISPYQKHDLIRTIGTEIGEQSGVPFIYYDWRPAYYEGPETGQGDGFVQPALLRLFIQRVRAFPEIPNEPENRPVTHRRQERMDNFTSLARIVMIAGAILFGSGSAAPAAGEDTPTGKIARRHFLAAGQLQFLFSGRHLHRAEPAADPVAEPYLAAVADLFFGRNGENWMKVHHFCRSLLLCLFALLLACLGAPRQAGATSTATGGSGSTAGSAAGTTGIPILRVALDEGVSSASFSVAQGSYSLTDGSTGVSLGTPAPGGTWMITAAGTTMQVQGPGRAQGAPGTQSYGGPITLKAASGGSSGSRPALFCYNGIQYRGSLVIQVLNNNLLVLNVLDVESYLYGVVGEEMGGGAPSEAYCAQAVASRSYALAMRGLSPWYDVGSDTGAQVYGGYTGEQKFACQR